MGNPASARNVAVRPSTIRGKGVFAAKDFRRGDQILQIDDSHVVTDPSTLTEEQHDFELDYLANGKIVIMQTPERYINHSCNPNSYIQTVDGVRNVLAMSDITAREEMTLDYSINGYGDATFECRCGSYNCRKTFHADFFKLPKSLQMEYLPFLDAWFKEEFIDRIRHLKGSR